MIERFNFFDVYGYFLPGFVFLALLWLPFGLVAHRWPDVEVTSALLVVVVAYLMGHVMRVLARKAFPSENKTKNKAPRYPSDCLLDEEDRTFSDELKKGLVESIRNRFKIEVSATGTAALAPDLVRRRRGDAFLLCRSELIRKNAAGYAEQFQGMYELTRGLSYVCALGAFYFFGWALGGFLSEWNREIPFGGVVVALVLMCVLLGSLTAERKVPYLRGIVAWGSLVVLCLLGGFLGSGSAATSRLVVLFLGLGVTALFASGLSWFAYKGFTREFAATVYRDFYGLP